MSTSSLDHSPGSPISTLPAELLSSVFRLVLAFDPELVSRPTNDYTTRTRTTLLRVCKRWKQVAYEDPQLWTEVPFGMEPSRADRSVQRSRGMPLDIRANFHKKIPHAASAVEQHWARVANLTIFAESWPTPPEFFDLLESLTRPAPMLELLWVKYNGVESSEYGTLFPVLPTDLFGGHMPELRSVILCMVDVDWSTALFSNLEHLEIDWFSGTAKPIQPPTPFAPLSRLLPALAIPPTPAELSRLLSHNRSLRVLKLLGCLPEPTTPDSPPQDIAELAYLSILELSGWVQECVATLAMVKFPPTCALSISCDDPDASYDAFEPLLSRVSEHLHVACSGIRTAEVYVDNKCVRVKLWPPFGPNEQATDRFICPATRPLVALEFRRADPDTEDNTVVLLFDDALLLAREILLSLSPPTLQTMSLSFPHGRIQEQEVIDLLRPFSTLECLKIVACGKEELSSPLDGAPHGGEDKSAQTGRLLPKLSVLELHRIQLPFDVVREAGSSVLYDTLFGYGAGPLNLRTLNLWDYKLDDDEVEILDRWLPGPARTVFLNTPSRGSS